MNDLFDRRGKNKTLEDWVLSRNYTKSSEVLQWGIDNYHNRALRDVQKICEQGKIRRLTNKEKIMVFGKIREGVWSPV